MERFTVFERLWKNKFYVVLLTSHVLMSPSLFVGAGERWRFRLFISVCKRCSCTQNSVSQSKKKVSYFTDCVSRPKIFILTILNIDIWPFLMSNTAAGGHLVFWSISFSQSSLFRDILNCFNQNNKVGYGTRRDSFRTFWGGTRSPWQPTCPVTQYYSVTSVFPTNVKKTIQNSVSKCVLMTKIYTKQTLFMKEEKNRIPKA